MTGPLNELYRVLETSKQSVHQYQKRQQLFDIKFANLLLEVDQLRAQHPGCGVEKMYYTLKPDFIGRDRFVEALMQLGYRTRRIKNYHRTTIPSWLKYPNLIEGLVVKNSNVVWQSDITYFELNGRFYYIVFILDVFSRIIVGYAVSDHLRAEANLCALTMAIGNHGPPKIHHSDRGSQYINSAYTRLLTDYDVHISMGLQAQDNAYAERINGTIKNEYLKQWNIKSFKELKSKVNKAVLHYNTKRIHDSLPDKLSPMEFILLEDKYSVVEEIYAPKRRTPKENLFFRSDKDVENDLICMIK